VGPNGTVLIDNPLYWYQFHPLDPQDFSDPDVSHPQMRIAVRADCPRSLVTTIPYVGPPLTFQMQYHNQADGRRASLYTKLSVNKAFKTLFNGAVRFKTSLSLSRTRMV
jgi:hypothetical protein